MFEWLFLRKATFERVKSILKKEGFSYTKEDVENLLKGNQKGVRYGNMVLDRTEGGTRHKRFIKIMLDGTSKTYRLFCRQVQITAGLHADKNYTPPTMQVLQFSLKGSLPYAIFETRENGDGFGFMHDTAAFYERFTEQEMLRLVEVLYAFHFSGLNIGEDTLKLTQHISSQLRAYKKEFKQLLNTRITYKPKDDIEVTDTVERILASYTGLLDIGAKVLQTLEKSFTYVQSSKTAKGFYLVHADMQIDNVYKHVDGSFELLDFEWVGRSDSPAIAIMYDYGNLRARAWSSPRFQKMLDEVMLEVGVKLYPNSEKMLQAALTLGMLRSSLMMSRFHLDFVNTVKKDKRTEEDYYAMYPKTIAALKEALH